MDNSINYIKMKRDKVGKCNICGINSVLTWDHVPPKKAIFFNDVEIVSIFNRYSTAGYPKQHSQNGTKFRTICAQCNNILGTYYDIDFIEFINEISNKVYKDFPYRNEITCKIKPVKVIKSLLGHLLAAKGDYEDTVIDREIREFVLSDNQWMPPVNIYYWFYPYPNVQIVRDLAICKLNGNSSIEIFSMLKMYPITFFITMENTFNNFYNLKDYCLKDIEQYVEINVDIDKNKLLSSDWPIIVDDNTIFLAGKSINSSVISTPRYINKYLNKK